MAEQIGLGCIKDKCGRFAISRGLCIKHYNQLRLQVLKKKTTWEKLAANGECVILDKVLHRKKINPFKEQA